MYGIDYLLEKLKEVTPLQEDGGVIYKRDDIFTPFDATFAAGGKLRQCLSLFDIARNEINNSDTIITPTSVISPQGPIVCKLATLVGKKPILVVGNKYTDPEVLIEKHRTLKYCYELGAEIHVCSALGFNTVLNSSADKLAKERNGFIVSFGINSEQYKKAIIDSTGEQIANLPKDLDHLVIPVGSGITAAGILKALERLPERDRPKNIQLVQIAGYDRTGVIEKELPFFHSLTYNFIQDKTYPYSQLVTEMSMGGSFQLDERYESKAHKYMRDRIDSGEWSGKICFWAVGKIKNY